MVLVVVCNFEIICPKKKRFCPWIFMRQRFFFPCHQQTACQIDDTTNQKNEVCQNENQILVEISRTEGHIVFTLYLGDALPRSRRQNRNQTLTVNDLSNSPFLCQHKPNKRPQYSESRNNDVTPKHDVNRKRKANIKIKMFLYNTRKHHPR